MGKPATECVSADSPASHPPWCPGSAEVQGRTATGCCIALHLFIVQSQFMATFCTCLGHVRLLYLTIEKGTSTSCIKFLKNVYE